MITKDKIFILISSKILIVSYLRNILKVTRPSFLGEVPAYFEALWYPHL